MSSSHGRSSMTCAHTSKPKLCMRSTASMNSARPCPLFICLSVCGSELWSPSSMHTSRPDASETSFITPRYLSDTQSGRVDIHISTTPSTDEASSIYLRRSSTGRYVFEKFWKYAVNFEAPYLFPIYSIFLTSWSITDNVSGRFSKPAPASPQNEHPPVPIAPSLFGHDTGIFTGSL